MKKVALALVVLVFTVPAMANVTITSAISDVNKVTIGYSTTGGDEVRAFALNIIVSDLAYEVNSARPVGDPNHTNYWVFPGSMTFTVVDGNTVVDSFGSPVAEPNASGGVVEMASLYAASDPCHPSAPPSSGSLCYFYFKKTPCGPDNKITVDVTLNTKRGGVVLKDPNVTPTVTLPAQLVYNCSTGCWSYPGQALGDATGDGKCNTFDLIALRKAWGTNSTTSPPGKNQGQYNCCSDHTRDGKVNTFDLIKLRQNWGRTDLGAYGDTSCP